MNAQTVFTFQHASQNKKSLNQNRQVSGLSFPTEKQKQIEKETKKLDDLVSKARSVLFKTSGVWPFDFFPDDVIIDKEKLTIISRNFFSSNQTRSILYKNISEITAETSVFFATLKLTVKGFLDEVLQVRYLKKTDAIRARRIIQGLINASEQQIDFADLETNEVRKKMELVGRSSESEE